MRKKKMVSLTVLILITVPIICPAQLLDQQYCTNDSSTKYALYVPTDNLKPAQDVLIFLEPAGRALLPLEKYRHFADEYNIFLASSYNVKNGQLEPLFEHLDKLIFDLRQVYPDSQLRFHLAGFSGGARAAVLYAAKNPSIMTVIGCGSGLPAGSNSVMVDFPYTMICGRYDMNLLELVDLEKELKNNKSILLEFDGGHVWPPDSLLDIAWQINQNKDSDQIAEYFIRQLHHATKNEKYLLARRLVERMNLLTPGVQFNHDTLKILPDKKAKRTIKKHQKALTVEREKKEEYMEAFGAISLSQYYSPSSLKPLTFWESEYRQLKSWSLRKNAYKSSGIRLLNFVRANSYEKGYFSQLQTNFEVALQFYEVMRIFSPDHWSAPYQMSKLNFEMSRRKEALRMLQDAIQNELPVEKLRELADSPNGYLSKNELEKLLQPKN